MSSIPSFFMLSFDPWKTRTFRSPLIALIVGISFPVLSFAQPALTIEQAVTLALTRNERAAVADLQVEAADARVRRARAFFFPDLNLNSSYSLVDSSRLTGSSDGGFRSSNGLNANLALAQTLFDARAFPLYRSARLLAASSRAAGVDAKRDLAFEAAGAFVVTLSQQRFVDASTRRSQLARASIDDAQARLEAGLVSSNDVTRAELELASAELALIRARASLEVARVRLGDLLAAPVSVPLAEPVELLSEAQAGKIDPEAAIAGAVARRADLAALRSNAEALAELANEPRRRRFPIVSVSGGLRATDEPREGESNPDPSASLNIGWNLFDGGEGAADRAERTALARIATLNADVAERRIGAELRTAASDVARELASIAQADRAAEAGRKNADETAELYKQGLTGALQLADANVRRFEAEIAEARARYELVLALLDWRMAAGLDPLGKETE